MQVNPDPVFHCDRASIILPPKPELTREGFLRAYMRIARVGNLTYTNKDGSKRVERVKPDVLFDPLSMDSFATKPLTLLHPTEGRVTPDNIERYGRGLTGHFPVQDGDFLGFGVTVTHRDAITALLTGAMREGSCGYDARIAPALDQPEVFDQLTRDGNHVAFCPVGRAGSDVKIHLDSGNIGDLYWQTDELTPEYWQPSEAGKEALKELQPRWIWTFDGGSTLHQQPGDPSPDGDRPSTVPPTSNKPMATYKFALDGLDFETEDMDLAKHCRSVDTALAQFKARLDETDQTLETLKADAAKARDLQKQLDTVTAERDALQAKLDAKDSEEAPRTDAADISERLKLIRQVGSFLVSEDPEFKEDSLYTLSPVDIKKQYIKTIAPDLKLDGKSDDYIHAYYDARQPEAREDSGRRVDELGDEIEERRSSRTGTTNNDSEQILKGVRSAYTNAHKRRGAGSSDD